MNPENRPAFPAYPRATPDVLEAVRKQLESGHWTRLEGAPELEHAWEAYLGKGHAWFLSSGTAALEAIFLGYGIQPGDEIITTPYTWGASVAAILAIGAVPVFADINLQTGQMDPESVRSRIRPSTRAILTVHLFGTPSPVEELQEIAHQHGLLFFEDASQAHGATVKGHKVGTFADGAAFSCMGLKPLGATEGGLAVFRSLEARDRAHMYGSHPRGMDPEKVRELEASGLLDTLQLGWRPSAISAAILKARLPDLDRENAARRKNARHLRSLLEGFDRIVLPQEPEGTEPVYHLLSFILDTSRHGSLGAVLERLREEKLPLFRYIPVPVHRMKRLDPKGYDGPPVLWHRWLKEADVDYGPGTCPVAEKRCGISLEMSWNFIEEAPGEMEKIASALRRALR